MQEKSVPHSKYTYYLNMFKVPVWASSSKVVFQHQIDSGYFPDIAVVPRKVNSNVLVERVDYVIP